MISVSSRIVPWRAVVAWRIAWTITSLVAVQTLVFGVSAAPVVLVWQWLLPLAGSTPLAHWALFSVSIAPSYALFAACLMIVSPLALRLLRWQTPADAELRIADMDWALLSRAQEMDGHE